MSNEYISTLHWYSNVIKYFIKETYTIRVSKRVRMQISPETVWDKEKQRKKLNVMRNRKRI